MTIGYSAAWNTGAYFSIGVTIDVHLDEGTWWAMCPACPGLTAAADSWEELFRLVAEFHQSEDSTHRDWLMLPIITTGLAATNDPVTLP